ncbi:collagenase-like [Condylostylus longicornis]|uniref:collagenase-like n=1 Tax=Condylostylus longicornis TaxID=2530218 RepID=UPI00244E3363|nr:collagenase-like [Condylostylus longicornis]
MIRKLLIINIFFFATFSLNIGAPYYGTLILGHEAEQNQFPWQVSITNYKKNGQINICGGTLISNQWILTAATCLGNESEKILIGLGSNELKSPAIIRTATNTIIHKDFNPKDVRLPKHNLAILKMNDTVNFTDWIEPILLPGEDQMGLSFEGVKARNSGWGTKVIEIPNDKKTSSSTTDSLNWHELTVISNQDCLSSYTDVTNEALCTRVITGGNVCLSDIGGPLVILDPEGWKLVGIASYTLDCDSSYPAVFSRITSYLYWISEVTGIKLNYY